jgi:hypothetical protein
MISVNFKLKFHRNSSIFLSGISVKKSFPDHYSQSVGSSKQQTNKFAEQQQQQRKKTVFVC